MGPFGGLWTAIDPVGHMRSWDALPWLKAPKLAALVAAGPKFCGFDQLFIRPKLGIIFYDTMQIIMHASQQLLNSWWWLTHFMKNLFNPFLQFTLMIFKMSHLMIICDQIASISSLTLDDDNSSSSPPVQKSSSFNEPGIWWVVDHRPPYHGHRLSVWQSKG